MTLSLLSFLRNKDFQEVTLEKDGVVLLQFALAYGFRNIQNLVQKLKRGKSPYHYVEVMACPSGKAARGCRCEELCETIRTTGHSSPQALWQSCQTPKMWLSPDQNWCHCIRVVCEGVFLPRSW